MGHYPKGMSVSIVPNSVVVRLYNTEIVRISNGIIRLQSGGWRTAHTKKCMNLILKEFGYHVNQVKREWFVSNGDMQIEFQDGMEIREDISK